MKAAYVSQFFKFSDCPDEKILALTYHTYIDYDEEVEKWLTDLVSVAGNIKPFAEEIEKDRDGL